MPHTMINNEAEKMMTEPKATKQDHEMILVRVERTPMGSRQPVHTLKVWDEVFSPALQQARLAEEKRVKAEEKALLLKEREDAKKSLTDTANKMTVKELNAELKEMKALQPSLVSLPKKAKKADLVREVVRVYMNAAALGLTVIVKRPYPNPPAVTLKKDTTGDAQ
jgi:hypothetical protein